MSLPVRQRVALDRIEQTLTAEEPGLGSLFAIFTRLTGHEAMPGTERVTASPLLRRLVMLAVTLIIVTGLIAALWLIPGGHRCPTTTRAAGHSISWGRPAGCGPGPASGLTGEPAR